MKFTFGIITSPGSSHFLQQITDSICDENIPEFEIIIVGGNSFYESDHMKVFPFNEERKPKWITRKKNIITENAKYDNIVYMHDYVKLNRGWYDGFCKFGNEFNICMTPIQNLDSTRYRDWTLWPHDLDNVWGPHCRECLLPYDVDEFSHWQYISGTYWVAKAWIMKKYPLDEKLGWGESEDVEWSKRVRKEFKFTMNKYSPVNLLKQKDRVFSETTPEMLQKIRNYVNLQS